MKFSWEWICEHIKLDMTAHEAADLLSLHGLTVDEIIPVDDDYVFDVDITTNRPDAMNIRGIARELSAITGVGLETLDTNYHETTNRVQDFASIDIEDTELCHRFCARVLKNLSNGESPDWMRRRLERVGMRSINRNVDITNYVLWELGHPLHAYDLNTIPGGKIIVRRAEKGETLTTLDDIQRELNSDDLIICDAEKPVGLAGIMGGADTEIEPGTSSILLECAWFDPVATRRTAKRFAMKTESSYRFERGMSHEDIPEVIDRTCHLYQTLSDAEICKEMIDEFPTDPATMVLTLNQERLCDFAGLKISRKRVGTILTSLGFQAEFRETFWKVSVPSHRVDVSREADLYEEIIRVIGYDTFPSTLPHVTAEVQQEDPMLNLIEECHGAMLSAGFSEVLQYDFIDPDENKRFAPKGSGQPFTITNPIAAPQWTTMRQSLVPSFIETLRHNVNHGNRGMRLYEIARIFHRKNGKPLEHQILGFAMEAGVPGQQWPQLEKPADFFDSKGVIESVFTRIGISGIMFNTGNEGFLAPWAQAAISTSNGDGSAADTLGWVGRLSDELQEHYSLPHAIYLGQVDLGTLLDLRTESGIYSPISRYPGASRDVSVLMPRTGDQLRNYSEIVTAIQALNLPHLADISLIDIYEGDEAGQDRSMTIRFDYQAMDHTMTVEEVEEMHGKVRNAIQELGITIR